MAAKKRIHTDKAPQALGPYCQAIASGNLVFCSGQVAIDPSAGRIVADTVEDQTRQIMHNLEAVLAAADVTLDDVVKTTIYLASMDDFQAVNEVYAEFFSGNPPARATVEVARLPADARVEIDAIASR